MKINKIFIATAIALICFSCSKKQENKIEPQQVKVQTMKIKTLNLQTQNSLNGVVEEEEGVVLSFLTGGMLEKMNIKEGQFVQQGQLLAQINEENLKNLHSASQALKNQAEDAYNRLQILKDSGSLADIQWQEVTSKLRQAESSEAISMKSLKDAKMYAPFSGYIATKYAEQGSNLLPNALVVKLVKINNVKVKISLPEEEINHINIGQSVSICVPALDNRIVTGRITEKGINADRFSRTYEVKILVNNADKKLLPGMLCDVFLTTNKENEIIILPFNLVQMDWDNRPFVWKSINNVAHKQYITLGENYPKGVQVLSGLSIEDEIITVGQQKVSQGMKISK